MTSSRSWLRAVVSRCDAPVVFQAAEHPLDGVEVAIEEWREAVLPFAIGLGRDVRHRTSFFDLTVDSIAVVSRRP